MRTIESDIERLWASEDGAAAEAYEVLDRATAARRSSVAGSPSWATARLAEGLSRMLAARQVAEWGNRSYAIQALEAALDGLRDAAAALPEGFSPSRAEVFAFRERLLHEWRAAQSEEDLGRIADLSIAGVREPLIEISGRGRHKVRSAD